MSELEKKSYTTEEAAQIIGCSVPQIYSLLKTKGLDVVYSEAQRRITGGSILRYAENHFASPHKQKRAQHVRERLGESQVNYFLDELSKRVVEQLFIYAKNHAREAVDDATENLIKNVSNRIQEIGLIDELELQRAFEVKGKAVGNVEDVIKAFGIMLRNVTIVESAEGIRLIESKNIKIERVPVLKKPKTKTKKKVK